jgi:uncharacterized alpha-E superfamily protein
MVAELQKDLVKRDINSIFEQGLHEFLTQFISDILSVSSTMTKSYFQGVI